MLRAFGLLCNREQRPASEGGPYKRVLSLTRQAVRLSASRGRANVVN